MEQGSTIEQCQQDTPFKMLRKPTAKTSKIKKSIKKYEFLYVKNMTKNLGCNLNQFRLQPKSI